jgi:cytochrome c
VSGRSPPRWPRLDRTLFLLACVLGFVPAAAASLPASAVTADETKALVDRAVTHLRAVGRQRAFAEITRPDGGFIDGELYVFCLTEEGVILAHGGNPLLVGKSLWNVRDPEGKRTTVEIIRLAQASGQGWLEYLWPNLVTGRVQRKKTYVERVDDHTFCAGGYYEPDPP